MTHKAAPHIKLCVVASVIATNEFFATKSKLAVAAWTRLGLGSDGNSLHVLLVPWFPLSADQQHPA